MLSRRLICQSVTCEKPVRKMNATVFVAGFTFLFAFAVGTSSVIPGHRFLVRPRVFLPDLTEVCLGCICEATTNCNLTIGCWRGRCGPFLISRDYWVEAGSPVLRGDRPNNPRAFLACVNDPICAGRTVKQYAARYLQDCNRDGFLDCDDYARIHYLGGRQCHIPIEHYGYYKVFGFCRESVRWLNG